MMLFCGLFQACCAALVLLNDYATAASVQLWNYSLVVAVQCFTGCKCRCFYQQEHGM
jgi:hypothetical protein